MRCAVGNAFAPDIIAYTSHATEYGLRGNGCWHRFLHAERKGAFQAPAFRTRVARKIGAGSVDRDGKEAVVVAAKQERLLRIRIR